MSCKKCGSEGKQLYRVPVEKQFGPVPIYVACYFCYLKLTGKKPSLVDLEPGTGAGARV